MKKICTILILLFVGDFFVSAQPSVFNKIFGGPNNEEGYDVIATNDGGYAIIGSTGSYGAGDLDVLLVKLDSAATIQWSHVYGGAGSDQALSLVQANDGGFVICGKTSGYGAGDFDVMLIKTDSSGNESWMKTFGGVSTERALNVSQTSDHGFILAGSTASYGQGDWDMLFIKTDSVGDTLWTKIMGGPNYDQGTDAEQTTDGGYIFSGRSASWGSGIQDGFLAKADANGDTVWSVVFGGTNWDEGMKVKQTIDGGYIVTGASTSFTNGGYDVYLNKIDSAGHITWSKLYAGVHTEATYDVLQLSDGGYIITGETDSYGPNHYPRIGHQNSTATAHPGDHLLGTNYSNVLAIRTDATGDTLWARTYGGEFIDEANSIIQTADGGFMIAAFSSSFGSDSSGFYLIKTDSMGYAGCYTGYANPVVSTPPTVVMSAFPHTISGLVVTNVPTGTPLMPTVAAFDACSAIASVHEEHLSPEHLFVYPNPATNIVTCEISTDDKNFSEAEITVYDMFGRLIKNVSARRTKEIQLSVAGFSPGIYEVKIVLTGTNGAEKRSYELKFAVQ